MPGHDVSCRGILKEHGGTPRGNNDMDGIEKNTAMGEIPVGSGAHIRLGCHGEEHLKYGLGSTCGKMPQSGNRYGKWIAMSCRDMEPGGVHTTGIEGDVGISK